MVVTFAATRGGYARHAQYALPIAVYPEVIGRYSARDRSRLPPVFEFRFRW